MVSQERARVTRERIIIGAAETFDRCGFGAASLSDIAEAAGVTKGALYFHFRSKDEIAGAVIDAQHAAASHSAKTMVLTSETALETAVQLSAGLARRLQSDPLTRAGIRLTTESSSFDAPVRGPYEDWLTTFESIVAAAIEAGDVRPGTDPAMLARFIIPSFTGIQIISEVFSARSDMPERVAEMWDIIFAATVPADRLDGALALVDRHLRS
ncbi:ScbR family autoregulator-binding transcription factor [Leifsonia sp. Leaf264]|uniref:ScbR family autoregulator-binding transcription factor n=1 Tax=Leifsonia sp. Leaf264 TaxID=1736314 RepID=UPI0006FF084F|nr:ScbR family autoregulator-binding transcription factor [Leifsonia sp. Leaf264]KQO97024.1 TetR family transcriptional regulator [Leifsonia sp. Leaf264]